MTEPKFLPVDIAERQWIDWSKEWPADLRDDAKAMIEKWRSLGLCDNDRERAFNAFLAYRSLAPTDLGGPQHGGPSITPDSSIRPTATRPVMEIHTDTCIVAADERDVHIYGPEGSHWATVRVDTAIDLVAATDEILRAKGLPSLGASARAWEQRAEARLSATMVATVVGLLGWTVAACLVVALLRMM